MCSYCAPFLLDYARTKQANGLRNPQKRGTPNLIILPTSSFCRVHALLGFVTPFNHAVSYADQLAKPEAFAISFNLSRLRDCLRFWVVS